MLYIRSHTEAQLSTANVLIECLMLRDNLLSLSVDFFASGYCRLCVTSVCGVAFILFYFYFAFIPLLFILLCPFCLSCTVCTIL